MIFSRTRIALIVFLLTARASFADGIVVFSEIMYHPASDEVDLEWIELQSQMAADVDLGGWSITGGVFYEFPQGTVIEGGSYLVVAISPEALAASSGVSALGPFVGRLDNSGERLNLRDNNGRVVSTVRYGVGGDWPVTADGAGLSVAKMEPHATPELTRNWAASAQIGGTPGQINFPSGDEPPVVQAVGLISYWSLDESSGTARDTAGGNNGSLGSGSSRVLGLVGERAVSFDGTANAFINVGSGVNGNFSVSDGLTVEALIESDWTADEGDNDVIFRKEDASNRILLALQHDGNQGSRDIPLTPEVQPVLSFGINVDGVYSELDMPLDGVGARPSLADLRDGETHHVAATYRRSTGEKFIYFDGVLAYQFSFAPNSSISSGGAGTAYIGNMTGRREPFNGTIDEVAVWERALSAAEVESHRQATLDGKDYFSVTDTGGGEAPLIAFNETSLDDEDPWIELVNYDQATVDLSDFVLASQGTTVDEAILGDIQLAPGDYLVLRESDIGFDLTVASRLYLFAPDRSAVVDGVRLKEGLEGRLPEASGDWLLPDTPTPGAENSFDLHDEIVINEIMYHRPGLLASPAEIEDTLVLPITADWRYDASGTGYSTTAWTQPGFDDSGWDQGDGALYNEDSDLSFPKGTEIPLGQIAYYFRSEFDLNVEGDLGGVSLTLNAAIDDGAIFYLNGVELMRLRMRDGAVDGETLAAGSTGNASLEGPFRIPAPSLVRGRNTFAVEVHQRTENSSDIVMGVEVSASVTLTPARPYRDSTEAWIELYNRSDQSVDMTGWKLGGGVGFEFPDDTILSADSYLLVAADAEVLRDLYPEATILGNLTGRLSHSSDRIRLDDDRGNPADTLRYYDRSPWPEFADGGGSSIELKNPDADNAYPESWGSSDESTQMPWKTYTYRQVATANIGPTQWREFVLGMLDDSEVLIDDLRVIEDPSGAARVMFANGDFESNSGWRMLGNHRHSAIIDDPDDASNRVLHLVASGPSEHMHNQVQIDLARSVTNGREYEVSFRARWLAGSNQVNTRLYFNRVPFTTLIDRPEKLGTPGERNSTFEPNVGPVFEGFEHAPVVPGAGESVSVSVRALDPDGVAEAVLWYSVESGAWSSRPMSSSGDGMYLGTIPGQSAARAVQFYVEATDESGATSTYPAGGRESRALYVVEDGQARLGSINNFRIVMTPADESFIFTPIHLMSNERLGCTVIWNESEVFYDVGLRLKGSQRGRPTSNRVSFNVRFQPQNLFRGVLKTVSLDRSGGWSGKGGRQDEIVMKHIGNKAGGIPMMYDDIARVLSPRSAYTGTCLLMLAKFNKTFLETAFEDGGSGTKFKFDLIYYPTTRDGNGYKLPSPDTVLGADNADHGDDKEVYRHNWIIRNQHARDDYGPLVEFCKSMGQPGSQLQAATEATMDIDQWMRAFAYIALGGVGDTYTFGNNHNNLYYVRPSDRRMIIFPWDMDFCWARGATSGLIGNQNLGRVINLAANRRRFYGHVEDIIDKSFNSSYMSRWTAHYGTLASQNYSQILTYISQRRSYALGQLPSPVAFRVTTNGGADFAVDTPTVTLEGDAGINVQSILIAEREDPPQVTFTGIDSWTLTVPLFSGENELTLLGFDVNGDISSSDDITVTTSFGFPAPVLSEVDPVEAIPGETITLRGTSFHPGIEVYFGDVPAVVEFDMARPTELTATVPLLAAGVVQITAHNSGSPASNEVEFTVLELPPQFIRGDANLDRRLDLSDAIGILLHLFAGRSIPCEDAADVNDDELLQLTDAVVLLDYLFRGGSAPSAPFPTPGQERSDEGPLDCETGVAG